MSDDHRDLHSLLWRTDDATLKAYSTSSRGKSGTILKVELEVGSTFRLSRLVEDLEDCKRRQAEMERARKEAARAPKPRALPAPKAKSLPQQKPLMLTYRGDK
ncbi:hypothetical protein [Xanthobacter autotrophicus]|uniref:hypothetical protein n=1 Tax=Xanthobacter autotrophicus TaxID=280 RepID=UPI00372B6DD1